MRKYAKRKDGNQVEIQLSLEGAGYRPTDLSRAGDGLPDILAISKKNIFVFLEVKTKKGNLTKKENDFFERYRGAPVHIARSPEIALEIMSQYD